MKERGRVERLIDRGKRALGIRKQRPGWHMLEQGPTQEELDKLRTRRSTSHVPFGSYAAFGVLGIEAYQYLKTTQASETPTLSDENLRQEYMEAAKNK